MHGVVSMNTTVIPGSTWAVINWNAFCTLQKGYAQQQVWVGSTRQERREWEPRSRELDRVCRVYPTTTVAYVTSCSRWLATSVIYQREMKRRAATLAQEGGTEEKTRSGGWGRTKSYVIRDSRQQMGGEYAQTQIRIRDRENSATLLDASMELYVKALADTFRRN